MARGNLSKLAFIDARSSPVGGGSVLSPAAAHGSPQRILLCGDLHANTAAAVAVIDHADALGADLILQAGDFGYWSRDRQGRSFLQKVAVRLERHNLELWWVDGNHEDLERLSTLPLQVDGTRWLRDVHGELSPTIRHLPRAHRWRWGETRWLAVGGAVSVDRDMRRPGVDWFPQEELTDAEADAVIADGPADVVVAHDAPLGVPFLRQWLRQDLPAWRRDSPWPVGRLIRSDEHQRRIRRVVEGVEARVVIHGHHHVRYDDVLKAAHGEVQVHGLGMDTDPLSARCLLVDAAGRPILEVP